MENNNQNLTVWQRLTQTFGPYSLLGQDYPTYQYDKTELLILITPRVLSDPIASRH